MKRRVWAAAATAMTTTLAIGIAGASPASAGETWQQSTVRADPNGGCPESTAEEMAQGWTPWTPSYEMWPNGGQGGWTCTRYIHWANDGDTPPSSSEGSGSAVVPGSFDCVSYADGAYSVDFGGSYFLAADYTYYEGSDCTAAAGTRSENFVIYRWASDSLDLVCAGAFGDSWEGGRLGTLATPLSLAAEYDTAECIPIT